MKIGVEILLCIRGLDIVKLHKVCYSSNCRLCIVKVFMTCTHWFDIIFSYQTIFRNPKSIRPYSVPTPERCNLPAAAIHATSDTVVIVDINAPAAHVAQHKWQPNTPDGQGAPFLFQHGKSSLNSTSGTFMRMFKGQAGSTADDWQFPQAPAFAASGIRSSSIVSITWDKDIITGKSLFFLSTISSSNSPLLTFLFEISP